MVPALAVGGVLLWRRSVWGHVLASIAAIQAALYLLVLTVNAVVVGALGFPEVRGELPIWGALFALMAALSALLLVNARR
jgi:hypothetical protein